jgi:plastocyanin
VFVLPVLLAASLMAGGAASASDDAGLDSVIQVITIRNFAYEGDLTVFAGSLVIVRNADTAPHTLTAVDGSFTTGTIEGGKIAVFRAPKTAGSYAITCSIHPSMSGVLRVGVLPPRHPVITIQGFQFTGDLTVRPGSTVTVTNADAAPHNVTALDGSFATITLGANLACALLLTTLLIARASPVRRLRRAATGQRDPRLTRRMPVSSSEGLVLGQRGGVMEYQLSPAQLQRLLEAHGQGNGNEGANMCRANPGTAGWCRVTPGTAGFCRVMPANSGHACRIDPVSG